MTDQQALAAMIGIIFTTLRGAEKVIDFWMKSREKPQRMTISLDPEVSRLIVEMHHVITKDDEDGAKRIYVPVRTIQQIDELHAAKHVVAKD